MGAKGSLYWPCPIQIPSKCWRWSNLIFLTRWPLSQGCPCFKRGASEEPTHLHVPGNPAAGLYFFTALKSLLQYYFFPVKGGSGEEPTHLPVPGIPAAGLCFLSGFGKKGVHEYNFCNKKFNPLDLSYLQTFLDNR